MTNTGTTDVSGFNAKVVFSKDNVLGGNDDWYTYYVNDPFDGSFTVPAGQTAQIIYVLYLTKGSYVPSGTWHVFGTINFDGQVSETDPTNNTQESLLLSELPPYEIDVDTPPTLETVTENSIDISYTNETDLNEIYWAVRPVNSSVPTAEQMTDGMLVFMDNNSTLEINRSGTQYAIRCLCRFLVYRKYWDVFKSTSLRCHYIT